MPVVRTFSALITITWSPVSMNGVYRGFSLPIRMRATCEARRPSVCSAASTTYHLRTISPCLGKYVDIGTLPDLKKAAKENRSLIPLTRTPGPSGGQPHHYQSLYDSVTRKLLSTLCYFREGSNLADKTRGKGIAWVPRSSPKWAHVGIFISKPRWNSSARDEA